MNIIIEGKTAIGCIAECQTMPFDQMPKKMQESIRNFNCEMSAIDQPISSSWPPAWTVSVAKAIQVVALIAIAISLLLS